MSIVKWSLIGATLFLFGVSLASAQTSFDVNLGFGTAWDSANSGGIDNASSLNAFGACTVGSSVISVSPGFMYCSARDCSRS